MAEIQDRRLPSSRKEALASGSPRFFKNTPCKNGHVSERYASGGCIQCVKSNAGRWRIERADHRKLMDIKWRDENKHKIAAKNQRYEPRRAALSKVKWAERDVEAEKERSRKFREANQAHLSRYRKEWKANNREKFAETTALWKSLNRDRLKSYRRNRRAKKRGNGGTHTASDIADIFKAQKGKCAYCKVKLGTYEVDHIVPVSRGGSNGRRNLQILCMPCNRAKNAKDPIDYARKRGMLL